MILLYNLVLMALLPIWAPWMLWRALRRKERPNWSERLGIYNLPARGDRKRIWVHAVSVGEVMASLPVLRELRRELPDFEILLSVTTSSGHQTARDRAEGLYDYLRYFPIDVARFGFRALDTFRPGVVAIMETELWPNFIWLAHALQAKVLVVNGRVSQRSFKRSLSVRPLYRMTLQKVSQCLMQTTADADRIVALGATSAEVLGNTKFDEAFAATAVSRDWAKELRLSGRPTVVIGSTRGEDEERLVLDALSQFNAAEVQVIHAPRHLERVPELLAAVQRSGWKVELRSTNNEADYIILDTYGELGEIYSVADVVVVGGGFGPYGGQNLIQPLAHGKPVIHGPHMHNFRDVSESAAAMGATRICESSEELSSALRELLLDGAARAKAAEAAIRYTSEHRGAARRYAMAIAAAARANIRTAKPGQSKAKQRN